ncbi:hypothetical protein ACP70R_015559 [Stipagrostis hirtigluma subsp. patula]
MQAVFAALGLPQCTPTQDESSFMEWWRVCRKRVRKEQRKGLDTLITMGAWLIWKHRNSCVFDGSRPCMTRLIEAFTHEHHLWCLAGARGLHSLGLGQEISPVSMDASENTGGRTPFSDLTNTKSAGGNGTSRALTQNIDAKERKRQRDRERYANLTHEQRQERNRKQRESRQKKKAQIILAEVATDAFPQSNKENMRPTGSNDWLHRNDSYQTEQIGHINMMQNTNECTTSDVPTLRREFLIKLLAYELNEAKEVLPLDVKSWLSNITPKED